MDAAGGEGLPKTLLNTCRLPLAPELLGTGLGDERAIFHLKRRSLLSRCGVGHHMTSPLSLSSSDIAFEDTLSSRLLETLCIITPSVSILERNARLFLLFLSTHPLFPFHTLRLMRSLQMPDGDIMDDNYGNLFRGGACDISSCLVRLVRDEYARKAIAAQARFFDYQVSREESRLFGTIVRDIADYFIL